MIEREHKFVVHKLVLPQDIKLMHIEQGYLPTYSLTKTRIRICGGVGYITIKSPTSKVDEVLEFEYKIPLQDAVELMLLCDHTLSKFRYKYKHSDGFVWDVDVFTGMNGGLVLAEIEFDEGDVYEIPSDWDVIDVTKLHWYKNSELAKSPNRVNNCVITYK
jgi:CYTH domain-containing protein